MDGGRQPFWYLFLLLKNRWFILKTLLVVMIPTVVITYLMTEKYTVETVIMPPEDQSASGMTIAGLGLTEFAGYFSGGMGFSLPLMTTLSDVYEEILRSRSLVESVIMTTAYMDSMNLRHIYEADPQQGLYWARKRFLKNYKVSISSTGFLEIEFTAEDPLYAVEVSEAIVSSLDSIKGEIMISRLQQVTDFMEIRLEMAEESLEEASNAIRRFEEEHNLVAPEQELSYFISNLTELKTEYARLLTEISAMRQGISGAPSATILFKERRAQELLKVINMLESGVPVPGYEEIMPPVSMDDYPELNMEYAILMADYQMALQINSAVKRSLQEAIAAQQKQQTQIRVLDPPRHPGWKSKPKKSLIWIEVFLISFVAIFAFIVARENLNRMQREKPELWEPWRKLLSDIRSELTFHRKK